MIHFTGLFQMKAILKRGCFNISFLRGLSFFVLCLSLFSCKKEEPNSDLSGVMYTYIARTAERIWADNALMKEETIKVGDTESKLKGYTSLPTSATVSLQTYRLYINSCNVGYESTDLDPSVYSDSSFGALKLPLFKHILDKFRDKADPVIEAQLKQHFEKGSSSLRSSDGMAPKSYIRPIDYRTTPIKLISVFFSADFLDVVSGSSLNHLLSVEVKASDDHRFIITNSKKVLWVKEEEITLQRYLSYSPMAPVELFLKFNNGVKLTNAVTGHFTVNMETASGKIISATTRTVTLLP